MPKIKYIFITHLKVDGDADKPQVISEFNNVLHTVMQAEEGGGGGKNGGPTNRRRASTDTLRAMYLEVDQQ